MVAHQLPSVHHLVSDWGSLVIATYYLFYSEFICFSQNPFKPTFYHLSRMCVPKNLGYKGFGLIVFALRFAKNYPLHLLAKLLPSSTLIHKLRGVKIGKHVHISNCVHLDDLRPDMITIEDDVTIGPHAKFFTHSHHHTLNIPEVTSKGEIILKKGSVVGAGSIILPGVTLGEGAIVGAGSVVIKDIDPKYIVAGSPAKVIGKRK